MEEKLRKLIPGRITLSAFYYFDDQRYAQIENILTTMKRWRPVVILILLLCALTVVLITHAIFIFIFYEIIYHVLNRALAKSKFLKAYASSRNLKIGMDLTPDMVTSRLSQKINPGYKTSYFISSHKDFPIKLFELNYSVGNKNKTTYTFTVSEITVEHGVFPHILLHRKDLKKHQDTDYFGEDKDTEVSISSNETTYNLYTTSKFETEALQICTPEFVELIKASYLPLDVEFAEKHVYIYTQTQLETEKDFDELYRITHEVIDRYGDFLVRMKDDYEALHEVYTKK